jgi:LmbE family N-acetylglucosaminyl deacetylase
MNTLWEKKQAAMRCHATQWSSTLMLSAPEERRRLFFGSEYFVRATLRHSKDDFLPDVIKGYLLGLMSFKSMDCHEMLI